MSSQKLKLKKRSEKNQKNKSDTKQKVALHALQKQLQVLNLREAILLISMTIGAGLLRVPMQVLPSVEPITFFALLAGWLFGKKQGFAVGAGALFISNFFVLGGHGPWTLFQTIGFGLAGYVGGFLREKASYIETAGYALLATLLFEIVINVSSIFVYPNAFLALITALPFIGVHLASNFIFSFGLKKARRLIYEKGQFNEKTLCLDLINELKHPNRLHKTK